MKIPKCTWKRAPNSHGMVIRQTSLTPSSEMMTRLPAFGFCRPGNVISKQVSFQTPRKKMANGRGQKF